MPEELPSIDDMPGFKRADIKKCAGCNKGVMEAQTIAFYACDIRYCMIDQSSVQREAGLEMMMGGHVAIAMALSPDPDIAKQISHIEIWVCLNCAISKSIAEIAELVSERDE